MNEELAKLDERIDRGADAMEEARDELNELLTKAAALTDRIDKLAGFKQAGDRMGWGRA